MAANARVQAEIEAAQRAEAERVRLEKEEERKRIEEERRKIEEEAMEARRRQEAEDEKKRKEEEEMSDLRQFATLEEKNRSAIRILREANLKASSGERPDASHFKSLNSTIAKCSAFAKRCNRITGETGEALLKESKTLNLSKYVSEVATQIASCPLKPTDIEIAVFICSELHQKYTDFSTELIPLLQKAISGADASAASAASAERRVALRLYSELFIAGVISDQHALSTILKETIEIKDPKLLPTTLQLVLSFVRSGGRDLLGIISKSHEARIDQCIAAGLLNVSIKESLPNIISPERRTSYTNLVTAFYQKMSSVLIQSHKRLRDVEQKNHDSLITRHEISADAAASYAKQLELFENFQKTLISLSDMLRLDMPLLPVSDKVSRLKDTKSSSSNANQDESAYDQGPWESEEAKKFYESLPDLKDFLPASLLLPDQPLKSSSSLSESSEAEASTEKTSDRPDSTTESSPAEASPAIVSDSAPNQLNASSSAISSSASDPVYNFFEKLLRCSNRQLIDDAALEFVRFNQRSWRPRLALLMHGSARNRLDVLRYFSRFVAILHPYHKDMGATLVKRLEEEFYFLSRQKDQTNSPAKLWNARFLAELTKFRVCPPNTVLNFLKHCLDDFLGYNVHVACELVDSCGRWLVNLPETRVRSNNLLDQMAHLKNTKPFHVTLEILIDNALQTARPPERVVKAVKHIPPIHQYIQRLLFLELRKDNVPFIVNQLKKLRWNPNNAPSPATPSTSASTSPTATSSDEAFLLKSMLKVYKNKYQHIALVSSIISQVSAVHDGFGVKFLDHLLEEIRRDLDVRKFNNHQKLVMNVSLAGELINHKLADHKIFYKLLYSFIRYNTITAGPKHGGPFDFSFKSLGESQSKTYDPFSAAFGGNAFGATPSAKEQQRELAAQTHAAWIEDSFRVRLVCTLLTTCRTLSCFPLFHDTQAGRMYARDLETFLVFFQRFLFSQKNISPELNSLLDDTWYLVQPPYLLHSMEEAETKLTKIISLRPSVEGLEERFSLPYKISSSSNASQLAEDEEEADSATDASQDDNASSPSNLGDRDSFPSDVSEDSKQSSSKAAAPPAEEDELAKMFDTMMSESMTARPNVNTRANSIFSVPLMALKRKAEVIKHAPVDVYEIPSIAKTPLSASNSSPDLSRDLRGVQISKSSSDESGDEENDDSDSELEDGEMDSEEDVDGNNALEDGDEEDEEGGESEEDDEEDDGSSETDEDEEEAFAPEAPLEKPQPAMQFQFLARKPGNKPVMGAIAIPLESNMVKRHLHAQDVAMKQREVLQAVTMKLHRMGEEADAKRENAPIVATTMPVEVKTPQPISYAAAVEALTSTPKKTGGATTSATTASPSQIRIAKR